MDFGRAYKDRFGFRAWVIHFMIYEISMYIPQKTSEPRMLLAKYVETADFTGMSEALKIGGWGVKVS